MQLLRPVFRFMWNQEISSAIIIETRTVCLDVKLRYTITFYSRGTHAVNDGNSSANCLTIVAIKGNTTLKVRINVSNCARSVDTGRALQYYRSTFMFEHYSAQQARLM